MTKQESEAQTGLMLTNDEFREMDAMYECRPENMKMVEICKYAQAAQEEGGEE